MSLDILCEVDFSAAELAALNNAADKMHISRGEVVRMAVKSFSAECVPTQSKRPGRDALCHSECVPTHATRRHAGKGEA